MATIQQVCGFEILDSRGNPTVAAEVVLSDGARGFAASPSGASTGSREAIELRDGDPRRYLGKGVTKAVGHVNGELGRPLVGRLAEDQAAIDRLMVELDGTPTKARLGANAILAVSLALAKATAASAGLPLYLHLGGGGKPRLPLRTGPPVQRGRHRSHPGSYRTGRLQAGHGHRVGPGCRQLGAFQGRLLRTRLRGQRFDSNQFVDYLARWVNAYPIVTIEDGMAEGDWDGWELLTARLGARVQLVGDDLFVTNTEILQQGISRSAANSILIKPNQIGTLTETLAAIAMAEEAGFTSVVSHRSGETEDTTIADLSVCTAATQIKTGSLCRSDRMAKYNRLLLIEAELGSSARFAGRAAIRSLR